MRHSCHHRRQFRGGGAKGFTLVESLMAAVLVGIAAIAFCDALTAGTQQSQSATEYAVATNLASALMNEIVSRPFRDPSAPLTYTLGPKSGTTPHSSYTCAGHYAGLTEAAGAMYAADGTALSDATLAGYSRSVTATYVALPGRGTHLPPAALLVTVEVKYNDVSLVTLKRLISSEERR